MCHTDAVYWPLYLELLFLARELSTPGEAFWNCAKPTTTLPPALLQGVNNLVVHSAAVGGGRQAVLRLVLCGLYSKTLFEWPC